MKFYKCENSVTEDDLINIEKKLRTKLPLDFKSHYLKYNGGKPDKTLWVDKEGKIESIEIRGFIPLLYNKDFKDNPVFSQPERIIEEWKEKKVPMDLIPFVWVWSHSYICLNSCDNKIYLFERHKEKFNPILISECFQDFIDNLKEIESVEAIDVKSIEHKFWGKVAEDWAGISSDKYFKIPHFKDEKIVIFLGEEFDEDSDEIEELPTKKQLDSFEKTFSSFLDNIEDIIIQIKEETFDRYKKIYAKYYENSNESGRASLDVDTKDKHWEYMKDVNYIRILKSNTIQITIRYGLDTEHGVEIKLRNNKIVAIGGIAET